MRSGQLASRSTRPPDCNRRHRDWASSSALTRAVSPKATGRDDQIGYAMTGHTRRSNQKPSGKVSPIAPPLTFTLSCPTFRSRMDWMATIANASLISIRSGSDTVRPGLG
jgi:hypothetical protein